jgi:hypothetical protein
VSAKDDPTDRSLGRLKTTVQWILFAALVAYFASLAIANLDQRVALRPWPWSRGEPVEAPAFVVLAIAFAVGWLSVWVIERLDALQRGIELRRCRRRIASLESEIARLRNLPLDEDLGAPPLGSGPAPPLGSGPAPPES